MSQEKKDVRASAQTSRILRRIMTGLANIKTWKYHNLLLVGYLIFVAVTWLLRYRIDEIDQETPDIVCIAISMKWICLYVLLFLCVCYIASRPVSAYFIENSLIESGVVDHVSLPPQFLFRQVMGNRTEQHLHFYSKGIPIEEWREKQEKLESSLNLHIIDILQGKNNREVVLVASSGNEQMPEKNPWDSRYMPKEPYIITCGISYGVKIEISLRDTPHILLAGTTGSGKSWLLKLLLVQLIEKGAEVTIADFKGGLDFGHYWDANAEVITEIDATIAFLEDVVNEVLPARKEMLKKSGCRNIDEFNDIVEVPFPRVIFACDEVAELMDKTGASKEQKEKIAIIESCLATIARLGRAVGIHLILAIQRPDANVLSGQIKNNIDVRICGRCEDTLSMIVLDNTDASRRISKESQGVFINQDGIMFKSFSLSEKYR